MQKVFQIVCTFLVLFTLTACGSGAVTSFSGKTFEDTHFTIDYPENWIVKTRKDFNNQIPQETIVTFSSPEPRSGYQSTLSIVNDLVPPGTISLEYAQSNINNAIQNVIEFSKLEERDVEVSGQKTKMLIFKGKSSLDAKTLRYIQLYIVQAERGYTITASDLVDTDSGILKNLEAMVLSFQLKL